MARKPETPPQIVVYRDEKTKRRHWMYGSTKLDANLFRSLGPARVEAALMAIEDEQVRAAVCNELRYEWSFWARPEQLAPDGEWRVILALAGRGWGKSRYGAETVIEWKRQGFKHVNLIGATYDDAWDVMVFGESGILAIAPPDMRPTVNQEKGLIWPDGSVSKVFTAEKPERLRGKQHQKVWADELCAWRYPEAWDQMKFGLRLKAPRGAPVTCNQVIVTTTPKPSKLLRELAADPTTYVVRGSTRANIANLAPDFYNDLNKKYAGTRLGRQELDAEILDDNPGALWNRADIDDHRRYTLDPETGEIRLPPMRRIVVAIDPAVTANEDSDETGIVVAGLGEDGHGYILEDGTSSEKISAEKWATRALKLYKKWNADRVVAEVNNGGDLVESLLRSKAPNIPYTAVRASRGKVIRAEPVAALYEQHKVHHCGHFPMLEDQMVEFNPTTDKKSPDRMDALVWALTELMLDDNDAGMLDFYEEEVKRLGGVVPPDIQTLKDLETAHRKARQVALEPTPEPETPMPTPKKPARGKSKKAAPEAAPVAPVQPSLSAKERIRLAALAVAAPAPTAAQAGVQPRQKQTPSVDLSKKTAFSDLDLIEQVFGDDLDGLDDNED